MRCRLFVVLGLVFVVTLFLVTFVSGVVINEFVVDPQTDWDESGGNPTFSDEWIELYNDGTTTIDLTNWILVMNDGTNETEILEGVIQADEYRVILNPAGSQNNYGQLILYNSSWDLVDSVSYGNWDDGDLDDNAPDGNAENVFDECLARIPNGADTDVDVVDFQKIRCTYGSANGEGPGYDQDLNATIREIIVLDISPRGLDFGIVDPGSQGNPALNGPIEFDATGSNVNVSVEVTEVVGYPFVGGLKIDGMEAVGSSWELICILSGFSCTYNVVEAEPTLDVPIGAVGSYSEGIIIYTVSGPTP
ncbi:MAG: lamin tail domain-containing protein [Nanoarchaeota archaeon]